MTSVLTPISLGELEQLGENARQRIDGLDPAHQHDVPAGAGRAGSENRVVGQVIAGAVLVELTLGRFTWKS